jgi:hypothetical protein
MDHYINYKEILSYIKTKKTKRKRRREKVPGTFFWPSHYFIVVSDFWHVDILTHLYF